LAQGDEMINFVVKRSKLKVRRRRS